MTYYDERRAGAAEHEGRKREDETPSTVFREDSLDDHVGPLGGDIAIDDGITLDHPV